MGAAGREEMHCAFVLFFAIFRIFFAVFCSLFQHFLAEEPCTITFEFRAVFFPLTKRLWPISKECQL